MSQEQLILLFVATVLTLAALSDVARKEVPNAFSLGGAILGLMLQSLFFGVEGFFAGVLGWLIGFALTIPFLTLGKLGADDVKLMAAVGACVGPLLAIAAVAGSLVMAMWLSGGALVSRWGADTSVGRTFNDLRNAMFPSKASPASGVPLAAYTLVQRRPYAVAILLGTGLGLWVVTGTIFGFH